MAVFLCGFMGCGKSTIGRLAAKKLGCGFCDTDELIVEKLGMSIPEIFEQKGEPFFRQQEAETVQSLGLKKTVVSTGGGALLNDTTAEVAKNNGTVIFLDVPFEVCYGRIKDDPKRPIVVNSTKEQLEELYNKRRGVYIKNSDASIRCDGSPVENTDKLIDVLKLVERKK